MKWFNTNKPYLLSASLICGNPSNLIKEIEELETAKIDSLHFDVMDGHFVPRIGLYPEMLKSIKEKTNVPIDVHLMISNPQKYAQVFIEAGANLISVHAESDDDLFETIQLIKSKNIKAGVALKYDTPLKVLDPVLSHIDLVMLMAIHPGILGQKIIPQTFDRIKELSHKLKDYPEIVIEIDGGVTPQTAPELVTAGAHLLVCGTGTIYRPHEDTLFNKIKNLRETIDASLI